MNKDLFLYVTFINRQFASNKLLSAFNGKSSFATIVKFFNMIDLVLGFSLDLKI